MAPVYTEPWKVLPKKVGSLLTEVASSMATHLDRNCTDMHMRAQLKHGNTVYVHICVRRKKTQE